MREREKERVSEYLFICQRKNDRNTQKEVYDCVWVNNNLYDNYLMKEFSLSSMSPELWPFLCEVSQGNIKYNLISLWATNHKIGIIQLGFPKASVFFFYDN